LKKTTTLLFLLRFIKIGLSILNLSLTAKYFGVSLEKDVWILAFTSMIVFDSAIWGPINETFRAKFVFIRAQIGDVEALKKAKSLIFFTSVISVIIVALVMIFPNVIAKIIAPSFHYHQLDSLTKMLVLVAPCLLFNQLNQIGISILNAYDSFFIPEISGFITNMLNLGLIIFLAPSIGVYSLLLAYYVSILFQIALLIFQINRLKINIFSDITVVNFSDFKIFLVFAIPFFFPYFLGQVSIIVEKILITGLGQGMVSMLDYSKKFSEILMAVLSSVLVTVLVPTLSFKFATKKPKEFVSDFMQIYQLGFLFITFVVAFFNVSANNVVNLLYNNGGISKQALVEISKLTTLYSWTTLAIFFYLIFGMALLASGKNKKYAFYGVITQLIYMIAIYFWVKTYGIYVIPIALFVSHLISGFFMYGKFPYKSKKMFIVTFKYFLVLALTTFFGNLVLKGFSISKYLILDIFFQGTVILLVLLSMLFIFKLDEREIMLNFVKKRTINA
jgi:peptidoglycan biosynthesis protein MviN/MurJ (putative lipid II flippase)